MADPGQWDREGRNPLFDRFRRASGAERQRLANALIIANTPLLKRLTGQIRGAAPAPGQPIRKAYRLVGSEHLDWDDALSLARLAMLKALDQFDPNGGSRIAGYVVRKIYYELQNAVTGAAIAKIKRGEDHPGRTRIKDDEHFEWLQAHSSTVDLDSDEPLSPEDLLDALEEARGAPLAGPPAPAPAPADDRHALDVFLEEYCRFAPTARAPMTAVHGRYRALVRMRGDVDLRGVLASALRVRGVRPITMRAPWSRGSTVKGYAGIGLQIA